MKWKTGLILSLILFALPAQGAGYRSQLGKWTRSRQWYSTKTFHANIIWKATYFSPDFRKAFTQRHVRKKFLDPLASAQYVADQEKKGAKYHEFFLGVYAREPYENLSLSPGSFWKVLLVGEKGESVEPVSIEFVEITPYEEVMFPYVDRWTTGYRVLFPKTDLGPHFKLSLRSVLGESVLKWE